MFSQLNPLHPNNSIHILHTDLSTFPVVMTRRICLTIRSFLNWDSFTLFSWSLHFIQGWYCKEKLEARYSYALKGELQLWTSVFWTSVLTMFIAFILVLRIWLFHWNSCLFFGCSYGSSVFVDSASKSDTVDLFVKRWVSEQKIIKQFQFKILELCFV